MDEHVEVPENNLSPPQNFEMKVKNYRAYRLVYYVLGFIEAFLALRFFLKLAGANPENLFAMFVYGVSGLLMLPFWGLFRGAAVAAEGTVRVFEPSVLVAMIVYALLAWGVAKGIVIFKAKPARQNP